MCCSQWSTLKFKTQLHIGFSIFNIFVLASIFTTIFVFTFLSTADAESHLRDRLNVMARSHTEAIVADSAKVFEGMLQRVAKNYLNVIQHTASSYNRVDHPFLPEPTYYEWVTTLRPPVVIDARYNGSVSFADSGYSVAGRSPYTVYQQSAGLNDTIERTQSMAPLMKNLYETNPEFINGYFCLTYDKVFREYPASSNGNLGQLLAYDCTRDDWYRRGILSASSRMRPTLFSNVYFDPWIKQRMITITQPMFDVYGTLIGVAGADMVISSIQASIASAKYLSRGRAVLFEDTGIVIADTSRPADFDQRKTESYADLRNPSITYDLWKERILTGYPFVEVEDYYIASRPLESSDGQYTQYRLAIMVHKDDVTGILTPVLDDISAARTRAIVVNSVVCVVVLAIAILVNVLLARRIVRPLTHLTDDSAKMIQQIGNDNLAKDIQLHEPDSLISETRQLQQAHREMIQAIQAQAAAQAQAQCGSGGGGGGGEGYKMDYALPAYEPGQGFDFSVLAQHAYAPSQSIDALPIGIMLPSPTGSLQTSPGPVGTFADSSLATPSIVPYFPPSSSSPPVISPNYGAPPSYESAPMGEPGPATVVVHYAPTSPHPFQV